MKKLFLIALVSLSASFAVFAQNEPIETIKFNFGKVNFFVAPTASFERIDGKGFISLGGKIGLVKKSISYGLLYQTFVNDKPLPRFNTESIELDYLQAGGFFEYSHVPRKAIHLTFPINFGFGRVNVESSDDSLSSSYSGNSNSPELKYQTFAFIEPGAGFQFNFHENIKLFTVLSYRITSNFNYQPGEYRTFRGAINVNSSDMRGLMGTIGLKFGIF